ncbi:MAG: hypothetical protein OXE73_03840 [Gammaproteobacteria bacterium]|nr:hypothetical protein [Gammaproteobacteria bacterium]
MRKGLLFGLVFLTLLPSCATAPRTYAFERSLPYGHPHSDVWAAVVEIATTQLPVSTIHADEGVGTITTLEHPPSSDRHHDCGSGGINSVYSEHLAAVSLVVRETDAGGTSVTVNTHFSAVRSTRGFSSRASSGLRVTCNSTGALEEGIHRRVREILEQQG